MVTASRFLLLASLLLLVSRPCSAKLVKTAVLVRNSEWGPGVDSHALVQREVLTLAESEAAFLLGRRLRDVYIRSGRVVPGNYHPAKVQFKTLTASGRAVQLGQAIANGMFEVSRGQFVQSEAVPVSANAEDDGAYCLASHPVLVDLPGNLESTLEGLHRLVKIDRDLDPFDIDVVAEPLLNMARLPPGVGLEFMDSLQKLAKWARDAKYGDPLAARVKGGRLAYQILTRGLASAPEGAVPGFALIVLSEFGFYSLQEMLVAHSSATPARILALEVHQTASGKLYLHVVRDFAVLALDACEDCELAEVKTALQTRGAFLDDVEWAHVCEKPPPIVGAAVDALAADASAAAASAAVAATTSDAPSTDASRDFSKQVHQDCPSEFSRGMLGGVALCMALYVLVYLRRQPRSPPLPAHVSDLDEPKPEHLAFIPRPTRLRLGSAGV